VVCCGSTATVSEMTVCCGSVVTGSETEECGGAMTSDGKNGGGEEENGL